MIQPSSSSACGPKVACVCFNPLISPNKRQDNDDINAIWADPPPANALDVATLLKQFGSEVIITGFIPKDCTDKEYIDSKEQGFATQFIEIENFPRPKKHSTSSYSVNPFTIRDTEKEQFIELILKLAEQTYCILFTGDLPKSFTLQDFKVLIKRLRKRYARIFIEMNNKIINITGTYLNLTYQSLDRDFQTHSVAWLAEDRLQIYCTGDISSSNQRFEIEFLQFERLNPKHIRSAIFASLIFIMASNVMRHNDWMQSINNAYTETFRLMNNAACEYERNEVLDKQTMRLLSIPNIENLISDKDIVGYLAMVIIHTVSKDTLILPSDEESIHYLDYFSIEEVD